MDTFKVSRLLAMCIAALAISRARKSRVTRPLQRTASALLNAAAMQPAPPPSSPEHTSAVDSAYRSLLRAKAAEMSAYMLIVAYRCSSCRL